MAIREVDFSDKNVAAKTAFFKPSTARTWRASLLPQMFSVDDVTSEMEEKFQRYAEKNLAVKKTFNIDGEEETYWLVWRSLGAKVHWIEGLRSVICNSEGSNRAACCRNTVDDPRWRFIAPLLVYRTEEDGSPIAGDKKLTLQGAKVEVWSMSQDKFKQIQSEHECNPMSTRDLKIEGKGGTYMNVTIRSYNEALWQINDKYALKVLKDAAALWEKAPNLLGKEMSDAEIDAHFNVGVPDSSSNVNETDFDDMILDGI